MLLLDARFYLGATTSSTHILFSGPPSPIAFSYLFSLFSSVPEFQSLFAFHDLCCFEECCLGILSNVSSSDLSGVDFIVRLGDGL